jgi:hypothetical protein
VSSALTGPWPHMDKVSAYHARRNTIIGALRMEGNMLYIDPATATTRLRLDIENLFQLNNQIFCLGRLHPESAVLTCQMGKQVYSVINDLAEILERIEPKKINPALLTPEDELTLLGYKEIKLGLIQSWEWISNREQEIYKAAAGRGRQ